MPKKSQTSMKAVAKGGAGFVIGRLSATLIKLISGVIVIRYLAKEEYGLLSFGYVIANMFAVFALLGLANGTPRYIAKFRDKENSDSIISSIIGSTFLIQVVASVFFTVFLYMISQPLAEALSKPDAVPVFRAFAFMVAPLVLIKGLTSVFRGIQLVKPKVIFEDTLVNVLRLVLVLGAVVVGLEFQGILVAYVSAVWVAFLFYAAYAHKFMTGNYSVVIGGRYVGELLAFSLPLLGIGMIYRLMPWAATLILGFTQPAEEIANYNAPLRLAALLLIAPKALGYLFSPIITRKFEIKDMGELKDFYVSTTKFTFIITFPLIAYFLMDAEYVVSRIFGERYADSADILRVITLGYCTQALTGPNVSTLIASGETRSALIATIVAGVLVLALGGWLIPSYGAMGAAISASVALTVSNLISSIYLLLRMGIHPIVREYMLPLFANLFIASAVYFIVGLNESMPVYHHIATLMFLFLAAFSIPLLTSSLNPADMDLIRAFERRFFRSSTWSDKIEAKLKRKY